MSKFLYNNKALKFIMSIDKSFYDWSIGEHRALAQLEFTYIYITDRLKCMDEHILHGSVSPKLS